ncbi:MAG: IS66 family transposase, partial [Planctomycetota bacterium]
YQAIEQHCQAAAHWHADETGWKVFVKVEEKADHKRTLWVYRSPEAIFFAIALTKGTKEAEAFFGPDAEGILNVDRASNYKALMAVKQGTLLLAFCWTHTRRDFLDAVRGDPEQQDWAESWLTRIGELFHVNTLRVAAWKQDPHGPEFAQHDAVLRARLEDFRAARDEQLQQQPLPAVRKRILTSLVNHWGLLVSWTIRKYRWTTAKPSVACVAPRWAARTIGVQARRGPGSWPNVVFRCLPRCCWPA